MRLLEPWDRTCGVIVLYYLIVHFTHNFLNFLVKKLSVYFSFLEALETFLIGVNLFITVAQIFLLCKSEHFLVILD